MIALPCSRQPNERKKYRNQSREHGRARSERNSDDKWNNKSRERWKHSTITFCVLLFSAAAKIIFLYMAEKNCIICKVRLGNGFYVIYSVALPISLIYHTIVLVRLFRWVDTLHTLNTTFAEYFFYLILIFNQSNLTSWCSLCINLNCFYFSYSHFTLHIVFKYNTIGESEF